MTRVPARVVWVWAACAALGGQFMPQEWCCAGGSPCCEPLAAHCGAVATEAGDAGSQCPLCRATDDPRPADTSPHSCRCWLDARPDQSGAPLRDTVPKLPTGKAALGSAAAPLIVPRVLGVSREYVAASLAVPLRPPRILFGVWRN